MSEGDKSFEVNLLKIIKKEFPNEKNTYIKNMSLRNYRQAADNVHKLKHKISILGLTKSYEIAIFHEDNLREGNANQHEKFEAILDNITKYLDHIK